MSSTASTTVPLEQARRIAVRAQLLDGSGTGVLEVVRRLGSLQLDPTARVAPSHLLVCWSRLGCFDRTELEELIWRKRLLFEWRAFVYPIEDLPAYKSRMRRFPIGETAWPRRVRDWLRANVAFRSYVLDALEQNGPMLSRELEDRSTSPWPSSGWTGNRNVSQMLEFLMARGDVAVVGRRASQRLWDLAERWYPPVEALPDDEADEYLAERKLRSLGVVQDRDRWRVHPEADIRAVPRRTTLLSPFDRLIHDRKRAEALFGFRYRIEIYRPKTEREHGYFVMPVLSGDRIAGRVDPELDRRQKVLRIHAVHWEADAVDIEGAVADLAKFLGAHCPERV